MYLNKLYHTHKKKATGSMMLLKLLLWYIKYEHRVTLKSQEYYRSISVTVGANKVIHYEAAQHAGPVKNIIICCSDII